MAYKTLIFGTDDLFGQLKPIYDQYVQRGLLEIVAYAVIENGTVKLITPQGKRGGGRTISQL